MATCLRVHELRTRVGLEKRPGNMSTTPPKRRRSSAHVVNGTYVHIPRARLTSSRAIKPTENNAMISARAC